jgi:alpha-mannosidase
MTISGPLRVVVVSHTHWDREWYHSAVRFRQRLVALVDELIEHPPAPGSSFLLDGQTILLDDYLAVRPERREAVAMLLRDRRLEAGPWLVLADELIPSGEALTRNLLAGRRDLDALGTPHPPVLYCPDSFGHPAMLPAIARGFGLDLIVVWRGYGGRRWPPGDTVAWEAPDGSRVTLYHLAPSGYELGASLPTDPEESATRWRLLREILAPRAVAGVALLPNGADHHSRQRGLPEALAALAAAARPDTVEPGSLASFAEALRHAVARQRLPTVRGELRDSYGYTWTLQGTFATRAAQKRRNAQVERMLVREAEPWAALAQARGGRDRGPLVRAAWRTLLESHPHDSLCGCSIDAVARAVDRRNADARTQAAGIRDDAILDVVGHDPVDARARRGDWVPRVILRNAAPRSRGGVVELHLVSFAADVPVGPGSAPDSAIRRDSDISIRAALRRDVSIASGSVALPLQLLGRRLTRELTESQRHYPDADEVVVTRALAWVDAVPGYGTRALEQGGSAPAAQLPAEARAVESGDGTLTNGILRLRFGAAGAVTVSELANGHTVTHALEIEEQQDRGDLYTPSLRGRPRRLRFEGWRPLHDGPLRAETAGRWVSKDGTSVEVALSLDAGAAFVRFRVRGVSRGRDRRLRIRLATGISDATVYADAAFGPVLRASLDVPPEDAGEEAPPPTAPLHRYVSLFDTRRGATIVSDGLGEYETDTAGVVAVTLVRAVGELSRDDLPERPGHAGWPASTPLAQSLGPIAATFALAFHGPRTLEVTSGIESLADDVLLPLRGKTLRSAIAIAGETSGLTLEGDGIAFSTLKPSEDGRWLAARCVNLTDVPRRATWRFGFLLREVVGASLDETPSGAAPIRDGAIQVIVGARSLSTILVR